MVTDKWGKVIPLRSVTPTHRAEKVRAAEAAYELAKRTGDGNAIAFAHRAWQNALSLTVRY